LIKKLETHAFSGVAAYNTALVLLQELNKDRRAEEIKAERAKDKEAPATEKQIAFLKDLGRNVEQALTKQEAKVMIEGLLTHRANGN